MRYFKTFSPYFLPNFVLSLWTVLICIPPLSFAESTSPSILEVGQFSQEEPGTALPTGWEPLTFDKIKDHTHYELVKDKKKTVIKAMSVASSSGLTKAISIDPKEFPIVQWRWKIENVFKKGNVNRKDGDDYPARLYITFAYDDERVGFFEKAKYETAKLLYGQYPPLGAINYIWESNSPVGTVVPNPYTDRVQMFVTESGSNKLGEWVTEEQNVYEDYLQAFGEEPPKISGVAIMTDSDNTQESAIAYFGDITFKKVDMKGKKKRQKK